MSLAFRQNLTLLPLGAPGLAFDYPSVPIRHHSIIITMIWTNVRPQVTRLQQPAVNTLEGETAFTLQLALPGWEKGQVELRVDGELLIVSGALEQNADAATGTYTRREFGVDQFEKSFHLPETINVDGIEATLDNGILSIALPKVAEAQPVRKQIAIA